MPLEGGGGGVRQMCLHSLDSDNIEQSLLSTLYFDDNLPTQRSTGAWQIIEAHVLENKRKEKATPEHYASI